MILLILVLYLYLQLGLCITVWLSVPCFSGLRRSRAGSHDCLLLLDCEAVVTECVQRLLAQRLEGGDDTTW